MTTTDTNTLPTLLDRLTAALSILRARDISTSSPVGMMVAPSDITELAGLVKEAESLAGTSSTSTTATTTWGTDAAKTSAATTTASTTTDAAKAVTVPAGNEVVFSRALP